MEGMVLVTQPNFQYKMNVNAAEHFMNQPTFYSTFPILVINKIFEDIKFNNFQEIFYILLRNKEVMKHFKLRFYGIFGSLEHIKNLKFFWNIPQVS